MANPDKRQTELTSHEAVEYYQRETKSDPGNAENHLNLGSAYYAAENFDGALKEFQDAIAIKPGLNHAHYYLGVLYAMHGDKESARKELNQVLQSDAHMMLKSQAKIKLNQISE